METSKTALIIGAGPGGLTAGLELLTRSGIDVTILEATNEIGGISRTVNYKGNRIDIGGHRFFSKSDRVLKWWSKILPVYNGSTGLSNDDLIQNSLRPDFYDTKKDKIMLIRNRVSRIFYQRKFFDYPISLTFTALKTLGFKQTAKIGLGYLSIRLFPIKIENSLEDFLINRFGRVLYETFFKDYTEKVWGVPCDEIKPEWGAQRIKGLSISKAIKHSITRMVSKSKEHDQKKMETSLIEKFMYPKFGPGQLWEEAAHKIADSGGRIMFGSRVSKIHWVSQNHVEVTIQDSASGAEKKYTGNYLISTMPIKDLITALGNKVPTDVQLIAKGLAYRDFITVGLLLKSLKIIQPPPEEPTRKEEKLISDNWIYIQENDVKLGRLQIFNNWSPFMVANVDHVWLGLEYFCNEGDELWNMNEEDFIAFAITELIKLNLIDNDAVLDSTMIKVPKAYPAYFGTYENFDDIRKFTDTFNNMYLIGRNGMHRYNNQDHSMLTAMVAVDNIISGQKDKNNIWDVNTENDYHETQPDN